MKRTHSFYSARESDENCQIVKCSGSARIGRTTVQRRKVTLWRKFKNHEDTIQYYSIPQYN